MKIEQPRFAQIFALVLGLSFEHWQPYNGECGISVASPVWSTRNAA